MIAAQQHTLVRQTHAGSNVSHEANKIRRPHAGIAAVLIDLVRSGFNQRVTLRRVGAAQRGLNDQRMRRTHGIDAHRLPGFMPRDDVE